MEDLALYAIDVATAAGASYADARAIEVEYQDLGTKDQSVTSLDLGSSEGIGIRVLVDGGWGFSSTQLLTKKAVQAAARQAVEVARASASVMTIPVQLAPEPTYIANWISPHTMDPFAISLETKLNLLLKANEIIRSVKGTTLAQGSLTFIREKKFFVSTQGTRVHQTFIRSSCGIEAYATNDDDRQKRSYPNSFGGQHELAGWEMVEKWDLLAHAERIGQEAVQLLTAPSCPTGETTVILGASQLGLQIHESTGHPSELDRALGQEINYAGASFLTPEKLNKLQYGSPLVNLVADATAIGALGSFAFDDEGVAAQRVYLVKDGLFCGYLSSRDTAQSIGLSRSGGMVRAESWSCQPIIRMTNISIQPGDAGSLDDIIASTDDGIFMDTNKSWSIDQLRYNFQFSTEVGWEIKNGKRGRLLKNCSYGGITPAFWNACDAVGGRQDYIYWGVPNCGKGQPCQTMWTGHGAAPARFRRVQVGMAHSG
jgi:TldD protein